MKRRLRLYILILLILIPVFLGILKIVDIKRPQESIRIAYVAPIGGEISAYWKEVEDGLAAGARMFSVDLTIFSQPIVDERLQLANLEKAIQQEFHGIITMALNPESFTPLINRAAEEGIPVVLLDGDAPNSRRISFIGSNNYEAGLLVAQLIDSLTEGNVRLGVVTAGITLRHITDRLDGIQEYFNQRENLELVRIEDSRADESLAFQKARDIIEEENINVIFAAGAVDSGGVARALAEELEKDHHLIGIGFDDTPETLSFVARGRLAACIAQSPFMMGRIAIKATVENLQGDHSLAGVQYTPIRVVDVENIQTYKEKNHED